MILSALLESWSGGYGSCKRSPRIPRITRILASSVANFLHNQQFGFLIAVLHWKCFSIREIREIRGEVFNEVWIPRRCRRPAARRRADRGLCRRLRPYLDGRRPSRRLSARWGR